MINEKFHVNSDVKHMTTIIYNKIYQLIPNLILKGELIIKNLLEDNYNRIKFKNDEIVIKLHKSYGGGINAPIINDDVIEDLKITIYIKLSKDEITQKKLINNKIRETINHECQHIIEFYHSDGNLSNSWSFNDRLKSHQTKFSYNNDWLDICYLFYLSEDHELRAKISQSLELLKNGEDIYSSDLYKKIDLLTKLDSDTILKKMSKYDDFGIILVDFVKNVLQRVGDYREIFISYLKNINKLSKIYKNKMLRVIYSYNNTSSFLEEYIERDIDYDDYFRYEKLTKRDNKIDMVLNKKKYETYKEI